MVRSIYLVSWSGLLSWVHNRVRLIGHPEYLSVLELDIQTKNFQALGRIPELSSAGFLQLAQHIEFVQNFCILICSEKKKTRNGQADVQVLFRRGKNYHPKGQHLVIVLQHLPLQPITKGY